jgi:hypothetical protein
LFRIREDLIHRSFPPKREASVEETSPRLRGDER